MKQSYLYEEFLTVKFNQEYYAQRLFKVKRTNRRLDIFLALFAGSSGIMAFGIWELRFGTVEVGKILFALLAGIGLILGICKPYLKLDDEIERLASIEGAYSILGHQLEDLITQASVQDHKTDLFDQKFAMARAIRGSLEAKEDKPPSEVLAVTCQRLVRTRHSDKVETLGYLKKRLL